MLNPLPTAGLLLAASTAFAQASFRFGPRMGLNYLVSNYSFADIMATDETTTSFRPGLEAGVRAQYNFTTNFALQSGLLFSQKGGRVENTYRTAYPTYTYSYHE